ncbi:MAG: DUF11 domain-containing protein [Porticoccaceae bacterium]
MKKVIVQLAGGVLLTLGMVGGAFAAISTETASGEVVSNTASVVYTVGTVVQDAVPSDPDVFWVDTKVDLLVTNTADATVIPGSEDQVLIFTVLNEGNATQGVALSVEEPATEDFNVTSYLIYIDNPDAGTVGSFDVANDILYTPGTSVNAADLDPYTLGDEVITVFVVSEIPSTAVDADTADVILIAQALDAGTTVGASGTATTESATNTVLGVDVIFADGIGTRSGGAVEDGYHSDTGTYTVATATVTVTKSSVVTDDGLTGPTGVEFAVPGAIVTYTITIANTSTTTALEVVISDAIPADVTYVANSVDIDDGTNTDTDVADGATGTTTGVGVAFADPNLTVGEVGTGVLDLTASQTVIITFDVTIN